MEIAPVAKPRATWSRRGVIFTLAATVVIIAAVASAVTFGLLYQHERTRAVNLVQRLGAEATLAAERYGQGVAAGKQQEEAFNKSVGLTWAKGYALGHQDVFAGFKGGWADGTWYLIEVTHGTYGHEIKYRYDFTVCQSQYLDRDGNLYGGGYNC